MKIVYLAADSTRYFRINLHHIVSDVMSMRSMKDFSGDILIDNKLMRSRYVLCDFIRVDDPICIEYSISIKQ